MADLCPGLFLAAYERKKKNFMMILVSANYTNK